MSAYSVPSLKGHIVFAGDDISVGARYLSN